MWCEKCIVKNCAELLPFSIFLEDFSVTLKAITSMQKTNGDGMKFFVHINYHVEDTNSKGQFLLKISQIFLY